MAAKDVEFTGLNSASMVSASYPLEYSPATECSVSHLEDSIGGILDLRPGSLF